MQNGWPQASMNWIAKCGRKWEVDLLFKNDELLKKFGFFMIPANFSRNSQCPKQNKQLFRVFLKWLILVKPSDVRDCNLLRMNNIRCYKSWALTRLGLVYNEIQFPSELPYYFISTKPVGKNNPAKYSL